MTTNPATQYATDRNLRARQRLWERQEPGFDVVAWTLDLVGVMPGFRVLDVGCGNGRYLAAPRSLGAEAVGCDLSVGMLKTAPTDSVVTADAVALPFPAGRFDVVLAPHMLYHVAYRRAAAREFRRVLARGGRCVAVANGAGHLGSLRSVVQDAAAPFQPEWRWTDRLGEPFALKNGAEQLFVAFDDVQVCPPQRARTGCCRRSRGDRRLRRQRRRHLPAGVGPLLGPLGRGRTNSRSGSHRP